LSRTGPGAHTTAPRLPMNPGDPGRRPPCSDPDLPALVDQAVSKTQKVYFREQHAAGFWWYPLESNDTITSEYIMLLRFLDLAEPGKLEVLSRHIQENQRSDGTWPIYHGGPGDLSTTAEAYFALKLAGKKASDPAMNAARRFILDQGGIHRSRIFTRVFLALFGCYPWKRVPSLPVEIMLLPPNFFFSVYDFSSWARATLVPMSVLLHKKVIKPIPPEHRVPEILGDDFRWSPATDWTYKGFRILDDLIKCWERLPLRGLRERAVRAAERWILDHQEPSGDWAGIQPAMVNSLLALHVLGYPLNHPVIQKGLDALERFCIHRGDAMELQACVSPVWDTALTCNALLLSGASPEHPAIQRAARWLMDQQIFKSGDWRLRAPQANPAGWAFEFHNACYPDVDDSAVVLMVLNQVMNGRGGEVSRRIGSGMEWVLSMRSSDGGWAAFDRDNNKFYLNKIPLADLEAMIDPSTADLTGRVLEMLGCLGFDRNHRLAREAVAFLRRKQEPDGSWWGRWGVNYIYGTWSVLCGLSRIGENMQSPYVQRAVQWLKNRQNEDGGWGETCESYRDPCLRGIGPSTPSQTAWALWALMAAEEADSEAVERGVRFLLKAQLPDGTWEEDAFTGTGFPKYFMIRYHNYRNCFPLAVLGMYRRFLMDHRRPPHEFPGTENREQSA